MSNYEWMCGVEIIANEICDWLKTPRVPKEKLQGLAKVTKMKQDYPTTKWIDNGESED